MRAIVTTARTCVVAVTSDAASFGFVEPSSFGAEIILITPVGAHTLLDAVAHCFGTTSPATSLPLPGGAPAGSTTGTST